MSMNTYPLHDYGLLIDENVAAVILTTDDGPDYKNLPEDVLAIVKNGGLLYPKKNAVETLPEEWKDTADAFDCLQTDHNMDAVSCTEFTGDAETLDVAWAPYDAAETCPVERRSWAWSDSFMAYIPLEREPQLMHAAYETPQDIVAELREKLKGIIPEQFDIRPYIVKINGSYFS